MLVGVTLVFTPVPAGAAATSAPAPRSAATSVTMSSTTATSTTATSTTLAAVTPPQTAVGRQVAWLLDVARRLPASDTEVAAHLSPSLLTSVDADLFNESMALISGSTGLDLLRYQPASATAVRFLLSGNNRTWIGGMSVDDAGMIATLSLALYPDAPTTWTGLRERLAAVAPQVSLLAARIDQRSGACRPVEAIAADRARPLGSAFKLYVLGALAEAVRTGRATWDEPLAIRDEWKSLPSGTMQNLPAGTTLPLRTFANQMISISDNTATDHLIHRLGRGAVERQQFTFGTRDPLANIPLPTTRELFQLKLTDYPKLLREYRRLPRPARSGYLTDVVDPMPLPGAEEAAGWTNPRSIDDVEWFASPKDICSAFSGLRTLAATPGLEPVDQALSINDGGLLLDAGTWRKIWFKGGSEPGVVTLNYLAETTTGQTFVVSAMASDPNTALPNSAVSELQALIRGAFGMVLHPGGLSR